MACSGDDFRKDFSHLFATFFFTSMNFILLLIPLVSAIKPTENFPVVKWDSENSLALSWSSEGVIGSGLTNALHQADLVKTPVCRTNDIKFPLAVASANTKALTCGVAAVKSDFKSRFATVMVENRSPYLMTLVSFRATGCMLEPILPEQILSKEIGLFGFSLRKESASGCLFGRCARVPKGCQLIFQYAVHNPGFKNQQLLFSIDLNDPKKPSHAAFLFDTPDWSNFEKYAKTIKVEKAYTFPVERMSKSEYTGQEFNVKSVITRVSQDKAQYRVGILFDGTSLPHPK